jgi:hypothetical protein
MLWFLYLSNMANSMRKIYIVTILSLIFVEINISNAQVPNIQWQKCLGGTLHEYSPWMRCTFDGGVILVSSAYSNDGNVTGNHDTTGATSDIWIVKLDSLGSIQWQKCLGGSSNEYAEGVSQTSDSGFVVCGATESNDGDVTGNHGGQDVWIVKLDNIGNIQWKKCYGGSLDDGPNFIEEVNNDGYIVVGFACSNDGNVIGHHDTIMPVQDVWVLKLNGIGNIDWEKCYGGTKFDFGIAVHRTLDGGYIIGSITASINGDVTGNHGLFDSWLTKVDAYGTLQWEKCYGGSGAEYGIQNVLQQNDSGYVMLSSTTSNDGDVSGNHGSDDFWLLKVNSTGVLLWQKCLGGPNGEVSNDIENTNDGGFIICGSTSSDTGDVTGLHGMNPSTDYWVIKSDSLGNLEWQKCLGSVSNERGSSISQAYDGGYYVGGSTNTPIDTGDVTGNHGLEDVWIVKLFPTPPVGILDIDNSNNLLLYPNPSMGLVTLDMSKTKISFIRIYNILGDIVFQQNEINTRDKITVDVSKLSPGLYYLVADSRSGLISSKFIKE